MEEYSRYLFDNIGGFSKNLMHKIKESLEYEFDLVTGETLVPGSSKFEYFKSFISEYDKKYITLKENTERFAVNFCSGITDFTERKTRWKKELEKVGKGIEKIKLDLIKPTFDLLGPEVIEASRSAESLANLMYQKSTSSIDLLQIVGRLARWQVLDELQKELLSIDLSSCFQDSQKSSKHSGRPTENFYDHANKDKLKEAFEAIYQEKYGMTLERGCVNQWEHTKQYLMAFILARYRIPYGKLASYYRFLNEVCKYTFIPKVRSFQNWFSAYQKFVSERSRRTANHPKNEPDKAYKAWKKMEQKFNSLEDLVAWIRERLPQYGIALA